MIWSLTSDFRLLTSVFGGPGGDLLSRVLGRSTIGAEGFHGRVRYGIGWFTPRQYHQVVEAQRSRRSAMLPWLALAGRAALAPARPSRGMGLASVQAKRAISTG